TPTIDTHSDGASHSSNPNRPTDLDSLLAHNDVVLYDRDEDPDEVNNLALDPTRQDLIARCSSKLERLISQEIGDDRRMWVLERPQLLGCRTWRGAAAA